MTTHQVRLQSRHNVAEGTVAFHFDKPAGFEFKPGQAIDLVLAGTGLSPDGQEARHAFSIVSAPFQDELVVATRMRDSAFKRALGVLRAGDAAVVDGPFGSLTLHKKQARGAVLIAGGIGITPFMSMLRHATHARLPQELRLLYTIRRPEDAAFLDELKRLESLNPCFRLTATMTGMAGSARPWSGATRRIDGALLQQVSGSATDPIFYLAGPPAMVEAMQRTLSDAGMDEDDIRSEEFHGY